MINPGRRPGFIIYVQMPFLFWHSVRGCQYLYAGDNPICLLDVGGMAAEDFNTVDPPTKTQPGIRNSPPQRIPDAHRVAEGGRIIRQALRGGKFILGGNPIVRAVRLVFDPVSLGTGDIPKPNPRFVPEGDILKDIMHLTNDPANDLSEDEKKALQERINSGMASQNDKLQYRMMTLSNEKLLGSKGGSAGYTAEQVKGLISIEEDAQFQVDGIKDALKSGDANKIGRVWKTELITTEYGGKTYILDGHNRFKALAELGQGTPAAAHVKQLSTEEASKLYKDKMEDIKSGSFNLKISE